MSRYAVDADWDELYVDAEWVAAAADRTIPVEGPSARGTVAATPAAAESDVDAADTDASDGPVFARTPVPFSSPDTTPPLPPR